MLFYNDHFKNLMALFLTMPLFNNFVKDYEKNNVIIEKPLLDEYDYIVIGAGGAGSVVASRLSEDENVKVLLLEAGVDDSVLTDIPAFAPAAQLTDIDWQYVTTPQEKGNTGLCGNIGRVPRGKVVGGSSALHYMMYARGNKHDYENWEKICNIEGWSYDDDLPFFKKAQKLVGPLPYSESENLYSREGAMSMQFFGMEDTIAQAFINAGKEIGYDEVDYNGPKQTGFSYVQATLKNGKRCSSAKAYLKHAQSRPNLYISIKSFVTKILINDDKKAYGVEFEKDDDVKTVKATKEVILSAGAYSSPQILMLSGVGPEDHLKELGITVKHNLPGVGQNMQDHISTAAVIYDIDQTYVPNPTVDQLKEAMTAYINDNAGPLTVPVGLEGVAFVHTKYDNKSIDFPDIQLVFLTMPEFAINATKDMYNICDEVWDGYFAPMLTEEKNLAVMYPMIMRPKSTGELKLKSNDPHELPLINPRLFEDEDNMDLKVLGDGIKMSIELTKTEAFKKLGIKYNAPVMPGCTDPVDSDEYYMCLGQRTTVTFYHTVATCTMGPSSNPNAVVDERLRVYGIKNLRVADASVIPLEITGNVNIPTVMVAERAADFIKQDNE